MRGQTAFTLFQSLPSDVLANLSAEGTVKRYGDKQLISSRGACDRELNIIEQGIVRVSNVDIDGRRTETALLEPGDSFGEFTLMAGTPRFFDFHADGETHIRTISKPQFDALMESDADFRDAILAMLTHRLLTAVGIIEDMRRLPLPTQLAKFLLHISQKQPDGSWHYKGTQTDIADALGVSRVSVGHALKSLQNDRLITTGYGCIQLENKAALQAWVLKRSPLIPV